MTSVGCDSRLRINVLNFLSNEITASLKIAQTQTVGTCNFNSSAQTVNNTNFSYLLTFSKEIDPSKADAQTISNLGTGGVDDLTWTIQDCGDNKNFKIEPTVIVGDGTIVPDISSIISALSTPDKTVKLENDLNQVTVNFDTLSPSLRINQSVLEDVGNCNFLGTNDPTNLAGFSYKIAFTEKINTTTFTKSNITNIGTGGADTLEWELTNCGDDQHFKLVVSSIVGDGAVIPVVLAGSVSDVAGNLNTISISSDNSITYDTASLLVHINQSINEVIGSCTFPLTADPTKEVGFAYKIVFSKNIDASTFSTSDIINTGTGGDVDWTLVSCGDSKTFKLVADVVEHNGTVIPFIESDTVLDTLSNGNEDSSGADSSVTLDTAKPTVTINQATNETIDTCTFTETTDPTGLAGFNYKIIFSEAISASSFATSDITNSGTSGLVTWNLANCGNSRVFKLTAQAIAIDGTVMPEIDADKISDLAGNLNTASTSTDNSVTFDSVAPTITINQSILETVGTCSFSATNDPTNAAGFSYKVAFSEEIDLASFATTDITNIGTGGDSNLEWEIDSCGDNRNFKLTATTISGDGTIIPRINANQIYDLAGNQNTVSSSIDNSVTYDTAGPEVTINQSVVETIGSCTFTATNDPTNAVGFSYRVLFSEVINGSSFTSADITNTGTGGGTTLNWSISSCGDNQNFKITTTAVSGDGPVIPKIEEDKVSDIAGNLNQESTSTDNSITYDTTAPEVEISRSIIETVGTCSFTETKAKMHNANFDFKIAFSEPISNSTFALTDIANTGTVSASNMEWTLTSCGDNQNYLLVVSSISAEGTIVPEIAASRVSDLAGNANNKSTLNNGTVTFEFLGWRQEAYIKASNPSSSDTFGDAISFDGDTLVVGVRNEDSSANTITNGTGFTEVGNSTNSGAVYVYKRSGVNWAQEAYIKALNAGSGDEFGGSVSLSGNILAVGARSEDSSRTNITNGSTIADNDFRSSSGAVYVYGRVGNIWSHEAYVKATAVDPDEFGTVVEIEGNTLIVSAPNESSSLTTISNGVIPTHNNISNRSGAIYIYRKNNNLWEYEALLKSTKNEVDGFFGSSISLDGETLVVGTEQDDSNSTTIVNGTTASTTKTSNNSGAAYVFRRVGNFWTQEAFIKAANSSADDLFGSTVSISGNAIVVGARFEDSNSTTITNGNDQSVNDSRSNSGAAYVYRRVQNRWHQEAYIKASNGLAEDQFGTSVSISGDTIVVGAPNEDSGVTTITNGEVAPRTGFNSNSGAAYVYKRTENVWKQEAHIKAVNAYVDDVFGKKVYVNGDSIVVAGVLENSSTSTITNGTGASAVNLGAIDSGAVYVYRNNARLFNVGKVYSSNYSQDSITLNWTHSGLKTTGYYISYVKGHTEPISCSVGTVVDVGNNLSHTFESLDPGSYYSFRICSYDEELNTSSGYVNSFTTSSLVGEPQNLAFTVNSDRAITINWTAATGAITGYRIIYQENGIPLDCSDGTSIDVGNNLSYQLSGLLTNTEYGVRVCSYDSSANLSHGRYVTAKTEVAANPINVYTTSIEDTNNKLTLHWENTSDRIAGFIITYSPGRDFPINCSQGTITEVGNIDSYTLSNLAAGASYAIRICAFEAEKKSISTGVTLVGNVRNNGWVQEAILKSSNASAEDNFGYSISLNGETLVVGSSKEDSNATTITNGSGASGTDVGSNESGAVYVYKRSGNNWTQEAYIKAVNAQANDRFGHSVSISKDTLAVGAILEDSNSTVITNGNGVTDISNKLDSGAVYIYKRTSNMWEQEAYVKAANARADDNFGESVSISGDTLVVGAPYEDSNTTTIINGPSISGPAYTQSNSGAAYVYRRSGLNWSLEAYIKGSDSNSTDNFGKNVSISGDTIAIASPNNDSNSTLITNGTSFQNNGGATNNGVVYIYKRVANNWNQEAYVKAVNGSTNDYFGSSLSISGNTLAVGAPYEDSSDTTITNGNGFIEVSSKSDSGAVYVYKRSGVTWEQEAYIKAVNSSPIDYFGKSVSISGDTLAVSSPEEDSNATTITNGTGVSEPNYLSNSGAVYVYKRNGNIWSQEAYIKAAISRNNEFYGNIVSLSGDTLAVGSVYDDSPLTTITNGTSSLDYSTTIANSGAVHVYRNNSRLFNISDVFTTETSQTSLTLNWMSSGLKTTGYFIAYAEGYNAPANCSTGTVVNAGNSTHYKFESLDPGKYYSFRICAYDENSNVASGFVISYPTLPAVNEPGDLISVVNSDRAVTFSWASAGGSAVGYRLVYQTGDTAPLTCNSGTQINVGNNLTYQLTGLLTNTTYGIRVCSYDASGNLSHGKYNSIKTQLATNPINHHTTSTDIANNELSLYWQNTSDRVTGFIVSYQVGRIPPASCSVGSFVDVGNIFNYNLENLIAGTSYAIRICSYESGKTNISTGSTLVGNVRNEGWVQEAFIKAGNNNQNDSFGLSVSLSGETLAVGSMYEDSNASTITNGSSQAGVDVGSDNSGAVYIYKRSGTTWAQEAYIKALNSEAGDYFGKSVSINGNTLVVGADYESSNSSTITNGPGVKDTGISYYSGATYVYKRSGTTWTQEAYIKALNNGNSDNFGAAVSIHGNTLAVGAPNEDSNEAVITNGSTIALNNGTTNRGAVYIYRRNGNIWSHESFIKPAYHQTNGFGSSLSLNNDTLVVGVALDDSNGTEITNGTDTNGLGTSYDSGAVYVYKRIGNNWHQEAYIKSENNKNSNQFGLRVSLDGDTLVTGAPFEDSNFTTITNGPLVPVPSGNKNDSGAVYVYKRTGNTWQQEAYIKAVNSSANDQFGSIVSIAGNTLAVSSFLEDSDATQITNGDSFVTNDLNSSSGAVYVYKRIGVNWELESYIKSANGMTGEQFGFNLGLNGDTLAVSTYLNSSPLTTITNGTSISNYDTYSYESGAVYIYRNNARLFDVTEVFPEVSTNSITLRWNKTGGTAVGYGINFEDGITDPPLCSDSMTDELGDVNIFTANSLNPDSDYTFRICAYDDSNQFAEDKVIHLRTRP